MLRAEAQLCACNEWRILSTTAAGSALAVDQTVLQSTRKLGIHRPGNCANLLAQAGVCLVVVMSVTGDTAVHEEQGGRGLVCGQDFSTETLRIRGGAGSAPQPLHSSFRPNSAYMTHRQRFVFGIILRRYEQKLLS